MLGWDACVRDDQGVYRIRQGSRSLARDEVSLILVSLAQLEPGPSGLCYSQTPGTLLVEAGATTTEYVDGDSSGCQPVLTGVFVKNFGEMNVMHYLAFPDSSRR